MLEARDRPKWVFALVAAPAIVVFVSIASLMARGESVERLLPLASASVGPILRSAAAAFATTLLVGLLGLGATTLLVRSWLMQNRSVNLVASIVLPLAALWLLVGAASFAFLWSNPYADALLTLPGIDNRSSATVVVLTAAAHILRYLPLLVWLLWISVVTVPETYRVYFRHAGFSAGEVTRTHLLALWVAPLLIVAAFAHQDSFGDQLISFLALRPSEATDTELVSHFLGRQFRSLAISGSARDASAAIVGASIAGALVSSAIFLASAALARSLFRIGRYDARSWRPTPRAPLRTSTIPSWTALGMVGIVLAAFLGRLVTLGPADPALAVSLLPSLLASLIVAALSWALAVAVNFAVREKTRRHDGSLGRHLGIVALVAMTLGFLPTIGLAVAVYSIAFALGPMGGEGAYLGWIAAQTLRMFPLVTVLLIPTTFLIEDQRVDYLKGIGAGYRERLGALLLRPYLVTHFAVLLIAANFVLNESVVGSVFQAQIPSVSELMLRATSGRSAAYPTAVFLSISQALIFGSLLFVWGFQVHRQWRSTRDGD